MSHTLHRRGTEESLKNDYVVFAMSAKGVNEVGSNVKLQRFLEIMNQYGPVNLGDMRTGNRYITTSQEIVDKASFMPETNDKARMLKVACRMMDTFQRGLLTLQRIRSNGEQRITVQYVTVADGGQAIIGDVNHGGTAK